MQRNSHSEALQITERRFGELIEQVYDYAIFFIDPEGRPTSWNQGVKRVLGFDEADFINADIDRIIFTPEDRESHIPEKERQEATIMVQRVMTAGCCGRMEKGSGLRVSRLRCEMRAEP